MGLGFAMAQASLGGAVCDGIGAAPGTPAYNPAWYALTDVYLDPVAGSDAASGQVGAPVQTWAEIVRRYGSSSPQFNYGQSVTFHALSGQAAGVDPIFFSPRLSGGGQLVFNAFAALVAAGAAFAAGALSGGFGYAGAVPSAGGTAMVIAGTPGYVVAKTLLHNGARASYAIVDSVGGGNATVSQPQTAASLTTTTVTPAPTVDNDWVAGDLIDVYTLPSFNLKQWQALGGDLTAGAQPCAAWVLFATIADASGTAGNSAFGVVGTGEQVLSCCVVLPRLFATGQSGRGQVLYALGCWLQNFASDGIGFNMAGGTLVTASGGSGGIFLLTNNAIVHGTLTIDGGVCIVSSGGVFSDGTFSVTGAVVQVQGIAWGSFAVSLLPGATWYNATGSTYVLKGALTTGALKLGTATTGTSYTPGTGLWASAVALTPANLDANNGLQNPEIGARYCNAA